MNSDPDTLACRKDLMLRYERQCWAEGLVNVAGLDEAGRGPLAGPVVAAAVIFQPEFFISEVNDSKLLTSLQRDILFDRITREAIAIGIGVVDNQCIDEINILQATFRAMHEALRHLSVSPDHVLVDGNRFVGTGIRYTTIVDGDALSLSIAAASIVAKVTRDRMMIEFERQFPGYGFAKHKGYGTREHRQAIGNLGLCPIHRRSFRIKDVGVPSGA